MIFEEWVILHHRVNQHMDDTHVIEEFMRVLAQGTEV